MKKTIAALFAMSIVVYLLQIIIFHDPVTTGFYIFQDIAFLPISIAVATIVVGEYLGQKEKRDRLAKTQMLTSVFFTELGAELMFSLVGVTKGKEKIVAIFENAEINDCKSLEVVQNQLREVDIDVSVSEETYHRLVEMIRAKRDELLTITSNPLLLDHESFTDLLWGIFHLMDEARLRGEYSAMSAADRRHMEVDFTLTLKLLLVNWAGNILYTKMNYPNYYSATVAKLRAFAEQ